GVHHVLSRVFKDVIPRFKAMKGYYAPRHAGWDCHGLPVELEIEKELGLSTKNQIEDYGVEKFNARCRDSVFRYVKQWDALTERIGFWVDLSHPYRTLDNSYIESGWWMVRQLWDKGLVYQGHRVTPHCPRCGTSLSSHEVALGYRDDTPDPSVYIKFQVPEKVVAGHLAKFGARPDLPAYLLAWTTTPWTLPGNTALAVAPEAEYAIVQVETDGQQEQLVLAQARLSAALTHPYQVLGTCPGSELAGEATARKAEYEPLYRLPAQFYRHWQDTAEHQHGGLVEQAPSSGETFFVIGEDFVSLDDGTGIVHVAPAFGEVDYQAGQRHHLYFAQPVDERGIMKGVPLFEGKFVKDADRDVMADLKQRGLLYRSETIRHTYPFCWRCGTPLLYYAKTSWYIRTTARKDRLTSGNQEINWYPEHIKEGRFGDWLNN
ncbi:MAG: class I tRNA ligase family protein, partial [Chloroflexota bacterium]|nr:class I tRNA ligase family protein [Chloroflexota bacterium]